MAGRMNWDRAGKEQTIRDHGSERLDGPPLAEEARQEHRAATKGRKERDTVGHLKRAQRDAQGRKWEIVDPATFLQRPKRER